MVYRSPDCHCIGVYVHCTTEILDPPHVWLDQIVLDWNQTTCKANLKVHVHVADNVKH